MSIKHLYLPICISASNTTHPKWNSPTPLPQPCSSPLPSQQMTSLSSPETWGPPSTPPFLLSCRIRSITKICRLGLQSPSEVWPPLCLSAVTISSQWPPSQAGVPGTALTWSPRLPFGLPQIKVLLHHFLDSKPSVALCCCLLNNMQIP